jgi:hypothetical protein
MKLKELKKLEPRAYNLYVYELTKQKKKLDLESNISYHLFWSITTDGFAFWRKIYDGNLTPFYETYGREKGCYCLEKKMNFTRWFGLNDDNTELVLYHQPYFLRNGILGGYREFGGKLPKNFTTVINEAGDLLVCQMGTISYVDMKTANKGLYDIVRNEIETKLDKLKKIVYASEYESVLSKSDHLHFNITGTPIKSGKIRGIDFWAEAKRMSEDLRKIMKEKEEKSINSGMKVHLAMEKLLKDPVPVDAYTNPELYEVSDDNGSVWHNIKEYIGYANGNHYIIVKNDHPAFGVVNQDDCHHFKYLRKKVEHKSLLQLDQEFNAFFERERTSKDPYKFLKKDLMDINLIRKLVLDENINGSRPQLCFTDCLLIEELVSKKFMTLDEDDDLNVTNHEFWKWLEEALKNPNLK